MSVLPQTFWGQFFSSSCLSRPQFPLWLYDRKWSRTPWQRTLWGSWETFKRQEAAAWFPIRYSSLTCVTLVECLVVSWAGLSGQGDLAGWSFCLSFSTRLISIGSFVAWPAWVARDVCSGQTTPTYPCYFARSFFCKSVNLVASSAPSVSCSRILSDLDRTFTRFCVFSTKMAAFALQWTSPSSGFVQLIGTPAFAVNFGNSCFRSDQSPDFVSCFASPAARPPPIRSLVFCLACRSETVNLAGDSCLLDYLNYLQLRFAKALWHSSSQFDTSGC